MVLERRVARSAIVKRLAYDPLSGKFTWLRCPGACDEWNAEYAGRVAGQIGEHGYEVIVINGVAYLAHHLAWVVMTGEWPTSIVDHANRVRNDNRWCNLRCATPADNARNASLRRDNTSGFKGVCAARGKWKASITLDGKLKHLGYYPTPEEAGAAYMKAANENFGVFATDGVCQ